MAYFDNYLIDTSSRVILGVEATPALFHQEVVAARKMMEHIQKFGLQPQALGADKAYGSGEFLEWLLTRGVQPHIPVIDRRHQTYGRFTRDQFRHDPARNLYYCPEGKALRYRGLSRTQRGHIYQTTEADCKGCLQKGRCTPAPSRKLFVHWNEPARQAVRALVGTPGYEHSRRTRYRIEALFAELKQRMRLQRVRLRRLWNVSEQFLLAATAQNLKRLVRSPDQTTTTATSARDLIKVRKTCSDGAMHELELGGSSKHRTDLSFSSHFFNSFKCLWNSQKREIEAIGQKRFKAWSF